MEMARRLSATAAASHFIPEERNTLERHT
jgi:hypothetical protein